MHNQKKPEEQRPEDSVLTPTYAAREMTGEVPKHTMPEQGTAPETVYNHDS